MSFNKPTSNHVRTLPFYRIHNTSSLGGVHLSKTFIRRLLQIIITYTDKPGEKPHGATFELLKQFGFYLYM